jgi:hypothetical protein
MDSDVNSSCSVVVGGFEPNSSTMSSSSGSNHGPDDDATEYCQCIDSEDVALLECQDCGSFFEPGIHYPLFLELYLVRSLSTLSLPCMVRLFVAINHLLHILIEAELNCKG